MKLLVMSDSHGHDEKLIDAILENPDADAIVFLGDGEWDFENAAAACGIGAEKTVCRVRGNCDRASREPETIVREFAGVRFLITHGHEQNVKYGLWGLVEDARDRGCTAALFGHTHRFFCDRKEGITLINPGSVGNGSYCIVQIQNGSASDPEGEEGPVISCRHMEIGS